MPVHSVCVVASVPLHVSQSFDSNNTAASSDCTDSDSFDVFDDDLQRVSMKGDQPMRMNLGLDSNKELEVNLVVNTFDEVVIRHRPYDESKPTVLKFYPLTLSKRKVHFCENVKVAVIPSTIDLDKVWYSFAEIQQFEREAYGFREVIKECVKVNKKKVCFSRVSDVLLVSSMKNNDSLWYSASEIDSFEKDAVKELKQFLSLNSRGKVSTSYQEWLVLQESLCIDPRASTK